jgi:membrane protease YdiL (CAAX protease family)
MAATHRLNSGSLACLFTVVTFLLSWTFMFLAGSWLSGWGAFALMWIPAAVAIGFRVFFREGFADAGFHAGPPRYWLLAVAVPLALATATYLVAWLLKQVEITPFLKQQSMFGPTPLRLTWLNADMGTLALLGQRFAVVMTLGLVMGMLSGPGEEIGWRGYLLPRLIKANIRYPILVSGLVWGTWHLPFVLLTFRHERYVTATLYFLLCVVLAVFISWIRLASNSVFVAGMAHGAYNTFYQDFYDHSFAGLHKWFWAGEVGLLCSVAFGIFALWLYKTNHITPLIEQLRAETGSSAVL